LFTTIRQAALVTVTRQDSASLRLTAGDEIPILRSCAEFGINLFLMKRLLLFFILSAAFPYGLFAGDALPFSVSVGGEAAKDGTPFAKIENPVAADAELAVESKSGMIIVNVNMVNAKKEPVPGSTPAVIPPGPNQNEPGQNNRWKEAFNAVNTESAKHFYSAHIRSHPLPKKSETMVGSPRRCRVFRYKSCLPLGCVRDCQIFAVSIKSAFTSLN
jgi:hypothetical protein